MRSLPFRHVCLDFHTSPLIPDIGKDFDPDRFAATLSAAHVNCITLHTKCHHGNCYYPTKVGRMHPGLSFDLFGQMLAACHRAGIAVEAYTSVVWDEWAAERHPEWLQLDARGRPVGRGPMDLEGRWRWLCMAGPYADHLAAQTEEVLERCDPDGFLFDIVCQARPACFCAHCLRAMQEKGVDPEDPRAAAAHSLDVERAFMARLSGIVRAHAPDATLWFNVRTLLHHDPRRSVAAELAHLSHIELESLPSGVWGYNHFPLHVRYLRRLGVPIKGQTGRFHRSWGDFGGIKNLAALDYECFSMLAHGVQCSIGDQMHPRGGLDEAVYTQRIGPVYGRVERMEPWCRDAVPLSDIGVLIASGARSDVDGRPSDEGAMRILEECHHQFDFVDREADFSRYRVLVAPDVVRLDAELAANVSRYLAGGGSLLASHEAGLAADRDEFAVPEAGARWLGPAPYETTYFVPTGDAADGIEAMPHVVYERGADIELLPGSELVAERYDPYFDRTWRHFSSHAQTPVDAPSGRPAALRAGRVAYVAFPVFRCYLRYGNRPYKLIVRNLLARLLPAPLVRTDAPSTARVTLLEQRRESRLVAHLLHAVPERRTKPGGGAGDGIDIIEDVIPLHDVAVAVRCPASPSSVKLVPQGTEIAHRHAEGYVRFTVPRVDGSQAIAIQQR